MAAVLAVVLVFVLLALTAFFLAMRGGPRKRQQTPSRSGRKSAVVLFGLSILVLGVAIPAYVIAQDKSRNSIPEANVRELTELQKEGRRLFGQRCRNCHTLAAANATAKIGPTLDQPPRPKELVLDAIEKGRANGNGNMPAGVVEGREAEAVAEFVAVASGGMEQTAPE